MLSSTPCILRVTSSSSCSSSPGWMNSAMLSLEWKRRRAAWTRSRILTETGTPWSSSGGAAVVMGISVFMSMGHAITRPETGEYQAVSRGLWVLVSVAVPGDEQQRAHHAKRQPVKHALAPRALPERAGAERLAAALQQGLQVFVQQRGETPVGGH